MTRLIRQACESLLGWPVRMGGDGHNRVVVLVYHSVHPTPRRTSTTPGELENHIEWLTDNCSIIPLDEALHAVRQKHDRRPSVAITFDDGFANNHEYALPILTERGVTATFFLTQGLIDADERVALRFARMLGVDTEDVTGLSWSQVRELQAEGMSIGAHTVTHPNLRELDPACVRREIELCKRELEDRLGVEIPAFAYPFGKPKHHFSRSTVQQVKDCGYSLAVAVHHRGVNPIDTPFTIPRFAIGQDDVSGLARKVLGECDGVGIWQQTAPRWLSHRLSPGRSFRGEASLLEWPDSSGGP